MTQINNVNKSGGVPSALSKSLRIEKVRLEKRYASLRGRGFQLSEGFATSELFVKWALEQPRSYYDWLIPNLYDPECSCYAPETSVFVPPDIGEWLNPYRPRPGFLLGVRNRRVNLNRPSQFITSSKLGREQTVRSTFYTQIETHHRFLEFRLEIAETLAEQLTNPEHKALFLARVERVRLALSKRTILNEL